MRSDLVSSAEHVEPGVAEMMIEDYTQLNGNELG